MKRDEPIIVAADTIVMSCVILMVVVVFSAIVLLFDSCVDVGIKPDEPPFVDVEAVGGMRAGCMEKKKDKMPEKVTR